MPEPIKLYEWKPAGYGAPSFFVAEHSEEAATEAVRERISKLEDPNDAAGFDQGYYTLNVREIGEVSTNDND